MSTKIPPLGSSPVLLNTGMFMLAYPLRLQPGADLKSCIEFSARELNLQAGYILTCVGSLQKVVIRFANQQEATTLYGHFEIVSLTGTIATNGLHLHISISDENGKTLGGHLMSGCLVYTTAEVVLGIVENAIFERKMDVVTGSLELVIKPDSKKENNP